MRFFRRKRLLLPLLAFALSGVIAAESLHACRTIMTAGQAAEAQALSHQVVLDAGHGGFDGGAVGTNGVPEKAINLAVTQQTAAIASLAGFAVTTVRDTDIAVNDEGLSTVRERKTSDIRNRMALLEKTPAATFVSIHQNHFSQPSCSGTQVFYSPNDPRSRLLAQRLQERIAGPLQPGNEREIKPAEKNLYILYHAQSPAVLVECGFLSNPAECERLCDPSYQQQLAFCITQALIEQAL